MPIIPHDELKPFSQSLLEAVGVAHQDADLVATMLLAANLRGIDSHGIHLLSYYLKQIEAGVLHPQNQGIIINESGGCLTYDGQNGLGQVAANHCCDHAIRLADQHGISIVTARETNHFGACFWWARKIAKAGRIAIVVCNASSLVAPWQGKQPRFGTNPICMAIPPFSTDEQEPFLLDMATTTVAANRIFKAWINQEPEIPPGWAMDADGVPTTNTDAAYKGLVMPLGGYKGYGLALMVEILSAVLAGGAMANDVGGIRFTDKPVRVSHTYLAIDIARFMPLDEFKARITRLKEWMVSSQPAKGFNEILMPGDPEKRIEAERIKSGIPIPEGNWKDLTSAAARLGITF